MYLTSLCWFYCRRIYVAQINNAIRTYSTAEDVGELTTHVPEHQLGCATINHAQYFIHNIILSITLVASPHVVLRSACLSVCPLAYLKNYATNFTNFCAYCLV